MMLWSLFDGLDELDYGKNIGGYLRHLYMKNFVLSDEIGRASLNTKFSSY